MLNVRNEYVWRWENAYGFWTKRGNLSMDFEIPQSGTTEVTMKRIRIGTRGSKLALRQAELVQEAIQQKDSGIETQIVVLHTKGDKILDKPLSEIGDKGVFVSEFEQALLTGEIDLAVHSAKDLPMTLADGLVIAAVLPRGDVRDVLVIPKGGRAPCAGKDLGAAEYHDGTTEEGQRTFVIGTGSRRRRQQATALWENVTCADIRGNVDTRLRKLKNSGRDVQNRDKKGDYARSIDEIQNNDSNAKTGTGNGKIKNDRVENYDGLILAKAGLDRLKMISRYADDFEFYPLAPEHFLPAACQGIIAVEAVQNSEIAALCREVTDADTERSFLVEREVLTRLAADCSDTAAAWCRQEQGKLILDVMYAGNRQQVSRREDCPPKEEVQSRKAAAHSEALLQNGLAMAEEAARLLKGKKIT